MLYYSTNNVRLFFVIIFVEVLINVILLEIK